VRLRYLFEGKDIAKAPEADLARLRRDRLGFVFQSFNPIVPRMLSRVDLPQPDGPMMATNSPFSMCRSMPPKDIAKAPEADLARLRRDRLGFVFQSFNLIDELTIHDGDELALFDVQVDAAQCGGLHLVGGIGAADVLK
jgi:ABC-type lipoprotein export system ATPase subunit